MTNETETGLDFAESLAAATPTPGGGAAAARGGLLATSLVRMVTGISLQKIGASDSEEGDEDPGQALLEGTGDRARKLGERFRALEAADIAVFDDFMSAIRLPKESEDEIASRKLALRDAAEKATNVPLDTLAACVEIFVLIYGLLVADSI